MIREKWIQPQYHKDYFYWENKYLEKFGKDSLDRVIMPLYKPSLKPSEEARQKKTFEETIEEMKEAIEKNEPFRQADHEVWNRIVF